MLSNSIRLFTIRGIEVGIHYSWLIIFGLMTWSPASTSSRTTPSCRVAWQSSTDRHHGAAAVRVGVDSRAGALFPAGAGPRRSITPFIFGGVSSLGGDAKEASTVLAAIVAR
jgi:hypothetical protein